MHFAVEVVNLGQYRNPQPIVELAVAAERAGWEGLFLWDQIPADPAYTSGDPWIALAAVAQATERIRLGTAVTPIPRHRPQVLARTLATLDLLSGGRVTLGAGLGADPAEYQAFGEASNPAVRAQVTDEALDIMTRLWSGEPVSFEGRHFSLRGAALGLQPVQRPRIPIWIGGDSPPALRRAARWDGWIVGGVEIEGMRLAPEDIEGQVTRIQRARTSSDPFEVAMTGYSEAADRGRPREYADAGVTWWLESLHGFRGSHEALLARVHAGPPV